MLISTKAIAVSAVKYAEADLIVKCFTEQFGTKSYLLRGILKSKKGKLRASMFQALTQLEIVAVHKNKNTLHNIREAKIIHPYRNLHTNVYKASIALFLSEILKNVLQEEETDKALYHFLETGFTWLDNAPDFANFHVIFILKLTKHLGFYPDQSHKERPYFNLLEGVFQVEETGKYCIGKEESLLLKSLLNLNIDRMDTLKLKRAQRTHIIELLLLYYELHFEGFRKPKSLEVLNQIFD